MSVTSSPGRRRARKAGKLRGKDSEVKQLASPPSCDVILGCQIAAYATLRASSATIASLRRSLGGSRGPALSASMLRHADDQTILALSLVLRAIDQAGWQGRSFANWGIVAAPNFFGRAALADVLTRYAREGPWGVSPQVIPNQSLHAVSGSISQVLKMYGPNFGVGGGSEAVLDAFMVAATFLSDDRLPGLWLTLTGHEEEYIPSERDGDAAPICAGVALALQHDDGDGEAPQLRVSPASLGEDWPHFRLPELIAELSDPEPVLRRWRLGEVGWIELETSTGRGA
jgi:hypothetical protein